jgi:hypothetical protein
MVQFKCGKKIMHILVKKKKTPEQLQGNSIIINEDTCKHKEGIKKP